MLKPSYRRLLGKAVWWSVILTWSVVTVFTFGFHHHPPCEQACGNDSARADACAENVEHACSCACGQDDGKERGEEDGEDEGKDGGHHSCPFFLVAHNLPLLLSVDVYLTIPRSMRISAGEKAIFLKSPAFSATAIRAPPSFLV